MKPCGSCQRLNPDEASFCQQCGGPFPVSASSVPIDDADLWRAFIGPSKAILFSFKKWWTYDRADNYYLQVFRKFSAGRTPRFAVTWNWPAFIFPPFLWFLYRKMYLYAGIYLLGPLLAIYLTKNPFAASVWSIVAGATGNYIYYWHVREQLAQIQRNALREPGKRERELHDLGGVQYYVVWLGVLLHVLAIVGLLFLRGELANFKEPDKQPPAGKQRSV